MANLELIDDYGYCSIDAAFVETDLNSDLTVADFGSRLDGQGEDS